MTQCRKKDRNAYDMTARKIEYTLGERFITDIRSELRTRTNWSRTDLPYQNCASLEFGRHLAITNFKNQVPTSIQNLCMQPLDSIFIYADI